MPPRCCGASSCLAAIPARAGPSLPPPGHRISTTASAASTIVHAMLAFVGARDWDRARRLELALAEAASRPTRYGETTRLVGLPACRALIAFGRGNDTLAIALLASLPALAHRIGGSHAQRDVLQPDSAAGRRAHAMGDPSIRNGAAANRCAAPTAGPGVACRNRPPGPNAPRSASNSGPRSRC